MKNPQFNKVLCKRELTSGKTFWWDNEGSVSPPDHPKRHERENRMLVEGDWYDIIEWTESGFRIINSQGNPSHHNVYTDEQKEVFPSHCDVYGPGDYAKWFYTPEELVKIEAGTYKQSFKDKHAISVFVGNYHWVKDGGNWIIAQTTSKHETHGKHYWKTFGHTGADKFDDDFEEIGHQVDSMETQERNKERVETLEELTDVIFPMSDSIRVQGTEDEKWHAPVEYHYQFVREAVKVYLDKSWKSITDLGNPFFWW